MTAVDTPESAAHDLDEFWRHNFRCGRCGEIKSEEYFYRMSYRPKHARRPVMYWCIRCCRAYKRSPRVREYDRLRSRERSKRA